MDSKRRERRVWPAAAVLVLSLTLHAALLLLPLPDRHRRSAPTAPPAMVVDLVSLPPEPSPQRRRQLPEPADAPREEPPPDAVRAPAEDDAEQRPTERSAINQAAASPDGSAPETERSATRIRAELLGAARDLGRESEAPREVDGLQYRDAPTLPSGPGWLDQYTGPVAASIDRWRGNDGSQSARIVTASGQVVCVRTRAPTTAETFNPWMSAAVPMMNDCGRERPRAPDGADPWLRRPGRDRE